MPTVEIDFDVFKEITARRASEQVTPNDVLRAVFKLPSKQEKNISIASRPWVIEGAAFPHGTQFLATYKGKNFEGIVDNGSLLLNGKRFPSPSGAAVHITGYPVNGWNFWKCKQPGNHSWESIDQYRKHA